MFPCGESQFIAGNRNKKKRLFDFTFVKDHHTNGTNNLVSYIIYAINYFIYKCIEVQIFDFTQITSGMQ